MLWHQPRVRRRFSTRRSHSVRRPVVVGLLMAHGWNQCGCFVPRSGRHTADCLVAHGQSRSSSYEVLLHTPTRGDVDSSSSWRPMSGFFRGLRVRKHRKMVGDDPPSSAPQGIRVVENIRIGFRHPGDRRLVLPKPRRQRRTFRDLEGADLRRQPERAGQGCRRWQGRQHERAHHRPQCRGFLGRHSHQSSRLERTRSATCRHSGMGWELPAPLSGLDYDRPVGQRHPGLDDKPLDLVVRRWSRSVCARAVLALHQPVIPDATWVPPIGEIRKMGATYTIVELSQRCPAVRYSGRAHPVRNPRN